MIKIILPLSAIYLCVASSSALAASCSLIKSSDRFLVQEGTCHHRSAPACSFNIAIALMAANEGIISDAQHPNLPFIEGYDDGIDKWRQHHNPTTWIRNSCLWYSKVMTQLLGQEVFQTYVSDFHYGNQDAQGLNGEPGVAGAWLSSSLQISPLEQIDFISRLVTDALPVSSEAVRITREILKVQTLSNGWTVYGKTGAAHRQDLGTITDQTPLVGWFVGWAEKNKQVVPFAFRIEDEHLARDYPSTRARANALITLKNILK